MKPNRSLKNFTIAMSLLLTTSITHADELSGHISGFIGLKSMQSSDFPDLDTHFSMGFYSDFKKESWPVSIALDMTDTGSEHAHDGMKDLAHTTEYHVGVRKIFKNRDSKIQPYIGGGVAFMYAELEYRGNNTPEKQGDRDVGVWLGTGMYYEMNPSFVLGLDVRYSHGEVLLFDKERNPGGISTGLTVGFQF